MNLPLKAAPWHPAFKWKQKESFCRSFRHGSWCSAQTPINCLSCTKNSTWWLPAKFDWKLRRYQWRRWAQGNKGILQVILLGSLKRLTGHFPQTWTEEHSGGLWWALAPGKVVSRRPGEVMGADTLLMQDLDSSQSAVMTATQRGLSPAAGEWRSVCVQRLMSEMFRCNTCVSSERSEHDDTCLLMK